MHPTDGELLALVHGENAFADFDAIVGHLESCTECAARYYALINEEVAQRAKFRALDLSVPRVTAAAVRAKAVSRRRRARLRIAAAALGTLVTAAAAAAPGSPVRAWIENVFPLEPAPNRAEAPQAPLAPPMAAGVQIAAGDGTSLVIEILRAQDFGQVRISFAKQPVAAVRAVDGNVAYKVGHGNLTLDNRQPATRYEIELSSQLARASVLMAGRVLAQLDPPELRQRHDTLVIDLSLNKGRQP